LLSLHGNGGGSPTAPWEAPEPAGIGRAQIDSITVTYELIAYVIKEFLDDASEEYRSSPVGAYLRKEDPAQYSRSTLPAPKPLPVHGFTVEPALPRARRDVDRRAVVDASDPNGGRTRAVCRSIRKFGAGKAGLVLSLRW